MLYEATTTDPNTGETKRYYIPADRVDDAVARAATAGLTLVLELGAQRAADNFKALEELKTLLPRLRKLAATVTP